MGECRRVLDQNWRTGTRHGVHFAYTCPSPARYPWQWYWDSCLTAIAARHLHPGRAHAELASLLAAADPDGFIGHTIFWERPVTRTRQLFYNVRTRADAMTATIQPPLLAWAWLITVGDPRAEPRIVAHHQAVLDRRDLEGDGLIWIIQPDESGLDASPTFDSVWGWRAHGTPGFVALVRRNRRLGFDARAVRRAGGPLVCGALTNTLHGLSRLSLGQPSITPAMVDRLYDESSGLFGHEVWPGQRRPRVVSWAALAPLALPDLPEAIGRRLVEEHLLDPYALLVARASALGGRRRADVLDEGHVHRPAALLAGADVGQLGLAGVAGAAAARLRRRGPGARAAASCTPSRGQACASITTRTPAWVWARPTSRGRAWPPSSSSVTHGHDTVMCE